MVPAAVVVEAADELEGIGVAEFGGAEEHDITFIDRDGGEAIGPTGLLSQARCRTGDIEAFRVLVLISKGGVETERVRVMEQGTADGHGLRLVRRRCLLFVTARARGKRACNYQ